MGFINPFMYSGKSTTVMFKQPEITNTHCTEVTCCGHNFGFDINHSNITEWNPVSGLGMINFGLTIYML